MSQFATRLYDVFLLIAPADAPPLWRWDIWTSVVPALTPVLTTRTTCPLSAPLGRRGLG